MTTYQVGETVNVGFYGVKVVDVSSIENSEIVVELDCASGVYRMDVPLGAVEIQRVIPVEGAPQPGDVWKDRHDNLWFASRHVPDYDDREDCKGINSDGWRTVLVPDSLGEAGSPMRPEDANQTYGPLSLVFRPEQSADGA
ncbi:hypothetical protein ACWEU6_36165 [Streptosporangium sandarakinum]